MHPLLSCAHEVPSVEEAQPDEKYYSSSIWGPACDSPPAYVGDWILFENMGAYTVAAASTFNGFQRTFNGFHSIYYVLLGPTWQLMQQVQNHDFPLKVEEQDTSALPACVLCLGEWDETPLSSLHFNHSCSCYGGVA